MRYTRRWVLFSLCAILFGIAHADSDPSGLQGVINNLQGQITQVQKTVPQQLDLQNKANQQAISQLQQNIQKQLSALQAQIQQVQTTLNAQIQQLQKEITQLSMMK